MNKKKRIFLICILSLLVVAILVAFVFATINYASSKVANAEYADLTNTDIINFNQLCNIVGTYTVQKSSGTENGYNFGTLSNITGIAWESTHHYFIKCYFTSTNVSYIRLFFNSWGVGYNFESGDSMIITGISNSNIARCYGHFDSNFEDFFAINIIDLDVMFGSSNVPTLSQAQEFFVANYYTYTKGVPMYWGINQNDLLQNLDYTLNTGILSGYSSNITNTNVSYDSSSNLILTGTQSSNYSGYFLLNFKTLIPKGSIVTLNFDSYAMQSGSSLAVVYADNYEDYITNIPTTTSYYAPFNYSFVVDRDISSLYLIADNYTTGTIATIKSASVSVQFADDYYFDLTKQYDLGYKDAETYYTDGYGHTQIYMDGYDFGYSKGISEGTFESGTTFLSTMFSGVGSFFAIQIFPNVTLGTFVLIPLLLGLIFFIVKLSRGGS